MPPKKLPQAPRRASRTSRTPPAKRATARPSSRAAPAAAFLSVCGHANIDVQLQVRDLPKPGQSAPVLERRTVWGGTAANVARHAGALGVATRLWSRVGEDFPEAWGRAFASAGVDLTYLDRVAGAQTPTCFIVTDALERQFYCMDQGPMARMAEAPPPSSLVEAMAAGAWLHIATGDPLAYAPIAAAARDAEVQVALDPGQEMRFRYDRTTLEGLLGMSQVLFVNEEELRVASGLLGTSEPEQLLNRTAAVVVTRGAKGASLYRRGRKALHANAFPVPRVVDPTGAGDAFRAGWYAALADGHPMEEALKWGQAAAAIVVQHAGPQDHVVTRSELATYVRS